MLARIGELLRIWSLSFVNGIGGTATGGADEVPPRRNSTVSIASCCLLASLVGCAGLNVVPIKSIKSSKQVPAVPAPVHVPVFGMKSRRVIGMATLGLSPQNTRRPGQV